MHILVIAQYFPPDIGGASTRIWNAVKGLLRLGHIVTVVAAFPHYPDGAIPAKYWGKFLMKEGSDRLRILRVWVPSLAHSGFLRRLTLHLSFMVSSTLGALIAERTDLVWGVSPFPPFLFLPGKICKIFKRNLFVLDVADPWPDAVIGLGYIKSRWAIGIVETFSRWIYAQADAITTTSPSIRKGLQRRAGEKAISVIKEGVDTQVFHPVKDSDRSIVGFKSDSKFIAMYSGILGPAYDFDSILTAAKEIENYPNLLFVIRGRGECEEEIRRKMSMLRLENIVLRTNFLEISDLVAFLRSADIFLLPMKKGYADIFPTKLYEYLACGKPIICGAKGEIADLIQKLDAGLVIEPESPKELAQAVLCLYKDEELWCKMSEKGISYVREELSIDAIGRRLEYFFGSLLDTEP